MWVGGLHESLRPRPAGPKQKVGCMHGLQAADGGEAASASLNAVVGLPAVCLQCRAAQCAPSCVGLGLRVTGGEAGHNCVVAREPQGGVRVTRAWARWLPSLEPYPCGTRHCHTSLKRTLKRLHQVRASARSLHRPTGGTQRFEPTPQVRISAGASHSLEQCRIEYYIHTASTGPCHTLHTSLQIVPRAPRLQRSQQPWLVVRHPSCRCW